MSRPLMIALASSLACCGAALANAGTDDVIFIPIDATEARPQMELTIDGGPPLAAIFDTGSIASFANLELAETIGLPIDGPAEGKLARMGAAFQTTLKNPTVGGFALPTMSMPVLSVPLPEIAVVFAPEIFNGYYVSIDLAASQLELRSKSAHPIPSGVKYDYTPPPFQIATIPVTIGADAFDGMMDTGSDKALLLPLALAESLTLKSPLKQLEGGVRTVHGKAPIPVYEAQIDGVVRVGPLELEDPVVKFTSVAPRIIVGVPLLRQLAITLDPEQKRLWVEKN